MTEETQVNDTPEKTPEDIYKEFNIDGQSDTGQTNHDATSNSQTQYIPDPVTETDKFTSYVNDQNAAIRNDLNQTKSQLEQITQKAIGEKNERDIERIVDLASGKIENVNKKYVRYELMDHYENDPRFRQAYDNRDQNPGVIEKIVEAMVPELKKTLAPADAQLAENQRALKESITGASQTTETISQEQDIMSKTPAEFDQWVRGQKRG